MTNDEVECQDFQLKITLSVLSKHCYLIIETTLVTRSFACKFILRVSKTFVVILSHALKSTSLYYLLASQCLQKPFNAATNRTSFL